MKKWQKRISSVANKLGFSSKMSEGKLTADDQKKIFAAYKEEFGITYSEDKAANEDVEETLLTINEQKELNTILGDASVSTVKEVIAQVAEQKNTIQVLSASPELDIPVDVKKIESSSINTLAKTLGRTAHSSTHLFGIEDSLFSLNSWYVNLTVTKTPIAKNLTIDQRHDFKGVINSFAERLVSRSKELETQNLLGVLNFNKMVSGDNPIDYSDLYGKAGEYIVRRTDLILAYLRTLPSVNSIFPLVSNIQNKEIAPGANFGELSQGYRSGKIFKGNVKFTAEIYSVEDVMFKFLFTDLIKLEKQYIGYLNREGSNVIKWSFIEWIMVHFGTILHNEQNMRRIVGTRTPQQAVSANSAMLAADGVLRAIERVEEDNKVYPNTIFRIYDETCMVDYLESFWDKFAEIVPSSEGYKLYVNLKHRSWYIRSYRTKYGKDTDFRGVTSQSINDVDANIIWVPNMPINNYKVWITFPGNVELYEDKPNEMLGFYFERDWEEIGVLSRWKEGAGLQQAGIQYKTREDLIKSEFSNQWLFTNYPVTTLSSDQTVIDGKLNYLFETGANTVKTQITAIENLNPSVVYKIICGDITNPTSILKTGKFSKITEDFKPKAIGDYLKVYAELEDVTEIIDGETVIVTRPTGNLLELSREVSI